MTNNPLSLRIPYRTRQELARAARDGVAQHGRGLLIVDLQSLPAVYHSMATLAYLTFRPDVFRLDPSAVTTALDTYDLATHFAVLVIDRADELPDGQVVWFDLLPLDP